MKTKRRVALTLWLGLAIIAATEILLAVDVHQRGVTILPAGPGEIVAAPDGAVNHLARWAAIHMTPVCWVGFLLVMDGLLALVARPGSPARSRPRRFALCFVSGVGVWLFFDWVNFFFIHAWDYHGLESMTRVNTYIAKFVAFGAISPAMFMTAELFQQLGVRRLRGPRIPFGRPWQIALFVAGVPALIYPFWVREPIGSTTLWLSLFLLFDPLNRWLGAPSLIGDWQAGRFGRSASLALGGLTCGFFWEFWNYWAAAKWTYNLPFLGDWEHVKLFEMPVSGFGGFLPFAWECWALFQTIVWCANRITTRATEPISDDDVL